MYYECFERVSEPQSVWWRCRTGNSLKAKAVVKATDPPDPPRPADVRIALLWCVVICVHRRRAAEKCHDSAAGISVPRRPQRRPRRHRIRYHPAKFWQMRSGWSARRRPHRKVRQGVGDDASSPRAMRLVLDNDFPAPRGDARHKISPAAQVLAWCRPVRVRLRQW